MASNRGPNAVGSSTVPPASSSAAEQQNSEYYKARNAAGGPSFQWAGTSGAGTATSAPSVPSGTTFGTGGVGGSWAAAPATTHAPSPSAAPPQMSVAARARAEAHGTVASAIPVTSVGGATPNGMYERNLIQELCPPGGMKAEPPEDKLAEFARAVPSLNADWICPALLDALEEGNPWIMRAKALCVIETVLTVMADHSQDGSNAYADFFYACSGEVEPLANHARASVKGPARRVLALLGVENAGNTLAGGEAAVATSAPAQEAPNLLDFDDPTPPAAPVAAPVAPPPSLASEAISVTSGGGDSLFSGLTTKAANPAPSAMSAPAPVENENDLLGSFGGQSLEDASIPSTPAAGSSDLFGNMIVKSADNQAKVGISNTHNMVSSLLD